MEKPKHGSLMIVSGTIMTLFLGVLYAWMMFREQIAAEFPEFTAAQLSLNFSVTMICFCLGGFFGGKLSAKYSQKLSVRVSAVMLLFGFLGTTFMGKLEGQAALILMYVCYGAMSGFGVGIGYNACVSGIPSWFQEKLGLVSGILLMGFGFGSLLLGLLAETLSASIGLFNVFRVYAILIAVVLFAGSFFIQKPPTVPASESSENGSGLTPTQMLRLPSFWLYFIWNTVIASSGQMVINSSAGIAVSFGAAAGFGLIISIFNGAGRPLTGVIMDKAGRSAGMLVMNLLLVLAGTLLLVASRVSATALGLVGMIIVGICYGGGVTISAKVINNLYGAEHYPVNLSLSNFCSIPAAFIGPFISGLLQDRSGGGYGSTFVMLLALAVIALVIFFALNWRIKAEKLQ